MEWIDRIEFAYPVSTMFRAEEPFLFGREPTPRRMPDGSIVSLLYTGGTQEPHPDDITTVIRSTDDGATWSKPELLFQQWKKISFHRKVRLRQIVHFSSRFDSPRFKMNFLPLFSSRRIENF